MNDKFGSMKSMLKRWKINLKKKKKKQQEEETELKKKRKSQRISFLYNLIAIVIMPFGYFFEKNNIKKEIIKLNTEIDSINAKELEKTISEVKQLKKKAIALKNDEIVKQVNKLEEKCTKKKKKLLKEENEINKTNDSTKKRIYSIKKEGLSAKKCNVDNVNLEIDTVEKLKKQILLSSDSKSKTEKNILGNPSPNKDCKKSATDNSSPNKDCKNIATDNLEKKIVSVVIFPKILFDQQKLSLKKKLNELDEFLNKMIIDLSKLTQYNQFYSFENDLHYFEKNLDELLEKNKLFLCKLKKESLYDYDKLNDLIEQIRSKILLNKKIINDSKSKLLIKKETEEKQKKETEEKQKKEKKQEKEEKQEKIDENKYILENILKQQEYLLYHLNMLQNSNNRKFTLKNNITNFLNDFMPKSLFPLLFIKNKFLSSILVGIVFNNSLRTMRKMIDPTIKFEYIKLNEEFKGIKNVYKDSYKQIQELKNDLITLNIIDDQLLTQLEQMEKICLDNIEKIDLKNQTIQKVLIKNYKN